MPHRLPVRGLRISLPRDFPAPYRLARGFFDAPVAERGFSERTEALEEADILDAAFFDDSVFVESKQETTQMG